MPQVALRLNTCFDPLNLSGPSHSHLNFELDLRFLIPHGMISFVLLRFREPYSKVIHIKPLLAHSQF